MDPNGELAFLVPLAIVAIKGALAGAAMDAGIELASQLIENGGDIDCVDWGGVGTSAVGGASSGAVGGVFGKAFTAAKRQMVARLEPGAKPGWSRMAAKDGPLAKRLE